MPAVEGNLTGDVSADGNAIHAARRSGGPPLPLVFSRQASAIEPPPPKTVFDPALPPLDVAHLKDLRDKDFAAALASGDLAPGTDAGVTTGVLQRGARRVLVYRTAKPSSLFEIGSVTKTFTGLPLAQMAEKKKVQLEEPVRALLPAGTVAAPAPGPEITLLDRSEQRSGLPRIPDNFKPADLANP